MKVTVLIATRDRGSILRRTLTSLFCGKSLAVADWEAVVVDNGSSDNTSEVCSEFSRRFPGRFRAYRESKQGKSHALNLGIAVARGEIVAFTDDDVTCAPDYIASVQRVFAEHSTDAAQGRTFLECEGGTPDWLFSGAAQFVGSSDNGDTLIENFNQLLSGGNMIVRAEAARAVGGFAPELGAGSTVGFSEDTEFSLRLRQGGYRFIYAPQIVVRVPLPRDRLTRGFFRKRYFRLGRSRAYYGPYTAPLWRYGLYVIKNCILSDTEALRHRLRGHPAVAMEARCMARFQLGFFWQHCLFYFNAPRRLTRITNWSDYARRRGVEDELLPKADIPGPVHTAQG